MKKQIYFLVSLFALIGLSSNVMGQQDATHYLGEVHKFKVDDHSAGGFTYAWKVYSDAGLNTEVNSGFILTDGAKNEATFEWTTISATATGTLYYVAVKETNATSGCSTTRYSTVLIKSATYNLIVSAVDDNGVAVTKLDDCMAGVGQVLSNSAPLDISKTNVKYYKVLLTNNGTNPWTSGTWKFDYTLTGNDGNTTANKTITNVEVVGAPTGVSGIGTGEASSATTVSVSNLGAFIIKVTTKDNPGTSTSFDVSLPFEATNLKVGAGNVTETGATTDNKVTYTLRTYPATSIITIN